MENKNNNTHTTTLPLTPRRVATLTAPDLWDRIQAFHASLAADAAFVGRLRAEGALDEADPRPLLLEYLRFTYLAWTDPEGATPSKAVDEVWHTHILFTRSYARFCSETRGQTLHHDPGGGEADEGKFREAYRRTLFRYETQFGPPPARFWPRPAGPPAEALAKPEPPRLPPPKAAVRTEPQTLYFHPIVFVILASIAVYFLTASAFAAITCGLLGGLLAILVIADQSQAISQTKQASPARAAPRPRPERPTRTAARGSTSRSNTHTTSGGDAGYPVFGSGDACPGGSSGGHGGHGDGGGCGDGGGSGGGSSCGSSCGGGGCGGG